MREARFLFLFALTFVVLHTVYMVLPDEFLRDQVHPLIVDNAAWIVNLVDDGQHASGSRNVLRSPYAALEVVRGCDGAGLLFLFLAAVAAFPVGAKAKLFGALAASLTLIAINQVRIAALYFVAAAEPAWFVPAHVYVAPSLIVTVCCLLFAGWVRWAMPDPCRARR